MNAKHVRLFVNHPSAVGIVQWKSPLLGRLVLRSVKSPSASLKSEWSLGEVFQAFLNSNSEEQ